VVVLGMVSPCTCIPSSHVTGAHVLAVQKDLDILEIESVWKM
jgi:hypothetical protein